MGDPAGGEEGEVFGGGEVAEETHVAFFAADAVALDFDVEAVGAEDALEVIEGGGDGGGAAGLPGGEEGAFGVASEGDQTVGVEGELVPGGVAGAFAFVEIGGRIFGVWILDSEFLRTKGRQGRIYVGRKARSIGGRGAGGLLGVGDELAEVLVAGAVGREEGERGAVAEGDLGPDEGAHAGGVGGVVKTRRAVESVAVAEGHGGEFEARGGPREIGGQGGTAQKTESAVGVKFDVGGRRRGRLGFFNHEWTRMASPNGYALELFFDSERPGGAGKEGAR